MPGLYYGDAGVGLLLLELALSTRDPAWVDKACEISRVVSRMPNHSPDLMTGAAGTGLFHLSVAAASGQREALAQATDLADWLLHNRSAATPLWIIPAGHEGLSGRAFLGLSHGTAGVGYFVAEAAAATADPALVDPCREITTYMLSRAQPVLPDGNGLAWPHEPGEPETSPPYWCHGTVGVLRFLLSSVRVIPGATVADAAAAAARFAAQGPQWLGATQCHGLAGSIDILLDAADWRPREGWRRAAHRLGENLAAYGSDDAGWPSDTPGVECPDLMVGQAGTGDAFLRLAFPSLQHIAAPRGYGG